jgi:AraC-like DNA-binding protein
MQNYALTRVETVGPLARVIEASGGSAARVFAKAGLPIQLLDEPHRLILLRDQFRLVETAARDIGDVALSARLSSAAGLDGLGPYGTHLRSFARLGGAIAVGYRSFASMLQAATSMEITVVGGLARWSYAVTAPIAVGRQKNELLALGYMLAVLRQFAGEYFTPDRIELPGSPNGRSAIEEVFRGGTANGPRAAIVFPAELLNAPNPEPLAMAASETASLPGEGDLSAVIRHLILLSLCAEERGIDAVARRLGISRRTLQRRLADEGRAFEHLVQDTLLARAHRLLQESERPIGEIALELGYADPAHFTRAFRRWAGETPRGFRSRRAE